MTKVTEFAIRTQAAIQHPGWRVDIADQGTVVLTHIMGCRRVIEIRPRRRQRGGPWMRRAKLWVPMVIWGLGMWITAGGIMALVMGKI